MRITMTFLHGIVVGVILGLALFGMGLRIWGKYKSKVANEVSKALAAAQKVTEQVGK
jgi:hypothetical protein